MGSQKQLKQDRKSTKIGAGDKRTKVPFADYRFVRIEFTPDEKTAFKSLLDSGEFDEIPLDEWIDRGYKLSLSRDDKTSSIVASLTSQYTVNTDAGLILTARGGNAITALAALTYKDRYIADESGWLACETQRGGAYDAIG